MTTPHDPSDPRQLTDEEEREVTAILADLASERPATPPAVAARLDDVLAGLVAERDRTVVPLDTRRRRRLPRVLLAAAAVTVGGYAVGNLALDGSLGEMSGAGGDAGGSSAPESSGQADSADPEGSGESLSGGGELSVVPRVRRDRLAADVRRVVRLVEGRAAAERPGEDTGAGGGVVEETRDCPVPRLTADQSLYEVRYRGRPAGLVVGPRKDGLVDVTVYACRDGGVRVARTVPAP